MTNSSPEMTVYDRLEDTFLQRTQLSIVGKAHPSIFEQFLGSPAAEVNAGTTKLNVVIYTSDSKLLDVDIRSYGGGDEKLVLAAVTASQFLDLLSNSAVMRVE